MTLLDFFTTSVSTQSQNKLAIEFYYVDKQADLLIKKRSITYADLDKESTRFSLSISNISKNKRCVIGLMLPPGIDLLIAIIGVLKSGCIFVPLELDPSSEFFSKVCDKTKMRLVVTGSQYSTELKKISGFLDRKWILHELQNFQIYKSETSNSMSEFSTYDKNEEIAYIMHTSGTTGEPKGIAVPHECIKPNITNLSQLFEVSGTSKIAMMSPPTFDPCIVEMFLAFANGATLVISSTEIKMTPSYLLDVLFQRAKVTIMQTTPALMKRFTLNQLGNEIFNSKNTSLKIMAFGGEACPNCATIKHWMFPCVLEKPLPWKFFNIYGITEVSSWAMCYEIPASKIRGGDTDSIPLGNLLWETELQIQDEDSNKVLYTSCCDIMSLRTIDSVEKQGFETFEGRLYIGGKKRLCYILGERDQDFKDSGDIVKATIKDGKILSVTYVGRVDSVLKRNGKKFSLSLLTNKLCNISDVKTSHVMKIQDCYGIEKIVACIVRQHTSIKRADLNKTIIITDEESIHWSFRCFSKLSEHLEPHYMPDSIVEINLLPITSHGKVDESELKKLYLQVNTAKNSEISERRFREALLMILPCCVSKSLNNINLNFSFLQLGGDSLGAVMLINWMDIVLKVSLLKHLPDVTDILFSHSLNKFVEIFINRYKKAEKFNENEGPCFKKKKICENEEVLHPHHKENQTFCISRGSRICGITRLQLDSSANVLKETNKKLVFEEVWKYNTGKCVDASPFIAFCEPGGTCFIGSHSHLFSAICLSTGKKIWDVELPDRIESSACLTSFDDTNVLAVGCYDGTVYCFHANTGELWWRYKTTSQVKSSPCPAAGTSLLFVGSHDEFLYGLDIQKKACVWKMNCGGGAVFSSPTVHQATGCLTVFVATLGGNLLSLSGFSGEIIWRQNVGKPIFSSPCVNENSVCIGCADCNVYFFTTEGDKLWSFRTGKPIFSSPVFSSDNASVLIGSHDGYLYNIKCNDGTLLWRIPTEDSSPIYSTPFVLRMEKLQDLVVFVSTTGGIYVSDMQSGDVLIKTILPGEVFSSPVAVNLYHNSGGGCKIVLGCRDDNVFCLHLKFDE